ncbi:MAG: tetratricopeptide repeat protein [Desulfovibrio sp.]|jgi:tetratricopeptide (TPR) repeat protein|nr:tetratricopeptide repeat protein [Desulfovibrio sp.]
MTTFGSPSRLTPRDLPDMEELLRSGLEAVFSFSGHALYFPVRPLQTPKFLPRERRLLLPLVLDGRFLGVFMARGVHARRIRPLLPVLPGLTELCLTNLALAKAARTDALTSLATEQALFARIEERAERVRGFLEDTAATGPSLPSLCFGLAFIRFVNAGEIARETDDYRFADDVLRTLARACAADLPAGVVAARAGRSDFALLLPGAGRAVCENTVRAALGRMRSARLTDPLTRRPVRPLLSAGCAVYPQDMRGGEMQRPMYDQARRLLARAALAAEVAGSTAACLSFARILHEGGVVRDVLGGARVRINLGRRTGAAEGMRFVVRGRGKESGAAGCKGSIEVLQCAQMDAVAELLHVTDAANPPEPGDTLTPLIGRDGLDGPGAIATLGKKAGKGNAPLSYADFFRACSRGMGAASRFTLAMLRFEKAGPRLFAEAARALRGLVPEGDFLCGQYGDAGMIFFHPGAQAEALLPAYGALCAEFAERRPAAGLAGYPFLNFSKDEIRDCVLKALDYALLLPEPRAGTCNSLALNISADRLYSQGDIFAAIEEYKLALLADADNVMARNSLGVCMAALGRREEAIRCFEAALRRAVSGNTGNPLEGQIRYNLGAVNQLLGRRRAAARHFRRCLAVEPEHVFAHIRLGQLLESGGRTGAAKTLYERAAALEDERGRPGPARRLLARLMLRRRRSGEARELLTEALLRNPEDAAALLDMAGLYLNGDESPELAEDYARKSLLLHDRPEARRVLARALRAQGREDEARSLEATAD